MQALVNRFFDQGKPTKQTLEAVGKLQKLLDSKGLTLRWENDVDHALYLRHSLVKAGKELHTTLCNDTTLIEWYAEKILARKGNLGHAIQVTASMGKKGKKSTSDISFPIRMPVPGQSMRDEDNYRVLFLVTKDEKKPVIKGYASLKLRQRCIQKNGKLVYDDVDVKHVGKSTNESKKHIKIFENAFSKGLQIETLCAHDKNPNTRLRGAGKILILFTMLYAQEWNRFHEPKDQFGGLYIEADNKRTTKDFNPDPETYNIHEVYEPVCANPVLVKIYQEFGYMPAFARNAKEIGIKPLITVTDTCPDYINPQYRDIASPAEVVKLAQKLLK